MNFCYGWKNRAFTLLELLIVIALIAILAFAGILKYRNWIDSNTINTEIRRMASMLQNLRMKAFSQKRQFKVYISPDKHRLLIYIWDGSSWKSYKNYDLKEPFVQTAPVIITDKGTFNATSKIIYKGDFNYQGDNCIIIDRTDVRISRC
ncbi:MULTISPECIES: pilus assembly FimT family protein [unclassified Desulfurobacterium]|uniref:pilus assembly FimT family protein n=1 Tax=Desulfurobacterium sp. TC5-1 TaxID=1158318 RepID=UPI0003B561F0|nr:prepilin-type N-terminal cleavage/methylation domain-containing protein [Desulfurobacterium sp. TC5-1]